MRTDTNQKIDNELRIRVLRAEIRTLERGEFKTEYEAIMRMVYHNLLMLRVRELGGETFSIAAPSGGLAPIPDPDPDEHGHQH